jgi:hypothetical protein
MCPRSLTARPRSFAQVRISPERWRLAALGEGGEFVQIGVLDRLGSVRWFPVRHGPDAVVGCLECNLPENAR